MFGRKKPDVSRRVTFTKGPTAKALMMKAAGRIEAVLNVKCDVVKVGKEFWLVAPEGTSIEQFAEMIDIMAIFYKANGLNFSFANADDEVKYLTLEPNSAAPSEPPSDMSQGPWVIVIRVDRDDAKTFNRSYATWAEVVSFVDAVKGVSKEIQIMKRK